MALALAACGTEPGTASPASTRPAGAAGSTALFDADQQTPGYFRDTYRLLEAQSLVDDETAAARLLVVLPERIAERGDLPPMSQRDVDTLDGLLILALRAVQATRESPATCRAIGETILSRTLGLDPARQAWNREHPSRTVEVVSGGAATLASEGGWAIGRPALGGPEICQISDTGATFDPGPPEVVWVEEYCEPDQTVGEYCEPDRWLEGDCWEEWVPEECSGGYWENDGYYQYRCESDGTCRTIWVDQMVYVDGTCSGGYWEEWCDSGYWEYGICYDGTFVPGYCEPGHYEYRYPGGTWDTPISAPLPPAECTTCRPPQLAIASTVAQVLHAKAKSDLTPEWQSALDDLVTSGRLVVPDEVALDAVQQIVAHAQGDSP
jgi:hypothetical protein